MRDWIWMNVTVFKNMLHRSSSKIKIVFYSSSFRQNESHSFDLTRSNQDNNSRAPFPAASVISIYSDLGCFFFMKYNKLAPTMTINQ